MSGNHNKVIGNTVVRVQRRGIIFGGISNIVMGNSVLKTALKTNDAKIAIQGTTSTNAIVEANVVREDNGLTGIVLEFQKDCVVEGNVCRGNSGRIQFSLSYQSGTASKHFEQWCERRRTRILS